LAGGFFIRGDGKEVPEGSLFFLETLEEESVHVFPVPQELQGLLSPQEASSSEDKDAGGTSSLEGKKEESQ
jgi:hypothetical protein